jgi:hypothetical protein
LVSLTGYDDTRSEILQSKVLGTVGEILSVGDPSLILVTVEMIFKLADFDAKTDCIRRLLKRIQSTDKQTWSSCFNGLKFLADQDAIRDMGNQSELVNTLVTKLAHEKSFSDAANALHALTAHGQHDSGLLAGLD